MTARRLWTPDEDAYLVQTNATRTVAQQAARLGRSRGAVLQRRSRLLRGGAFSSQDRKRHRPWTADELERLRELIAQGLSSRTIAHKLKRSQRAIQDRAHTLGGLQAFRCDPLARVWTTPAIAALLGVSKSTVAVWRVRGWLPHVRVEPGTRGRPAFITDDQLMTFLADKRYWPAWSPALMTDPDWRAYAEDLRRDGDWISSKQAAARLGLTMRSFQRRRTWGDVADVQALRYGREMLFWGPDVERLARGQQRRAT